MTPSRRRFLALLVAAGFRPPTASADTAEDAGSAGTKYFEAQSRQAVSIDGSRFDGATASVLVRTERVGAGSKPWGKSVFKLKATAARGSLAASDLRFVPESLASIGFGFEVHVSFDAGGRPEPLRITPSPGFRVLVQPVEGLTLGEFIVRPLVSHRAAVSDKPSLDWDYEQRLVPDPDAPWVYVGPGKTDRTNDWLKGGPLTLSVVLDVHRLEGGELQRVHRLDLGALTVPPRLLDQLRAQSVKAIRDQEPHVRAFVPRGGCFLTTAVCDTLGLPDDGWELRTLRRFRDRWADACPANRLLVDEYYRIAPAYAASLASLRERYTISARLYAGYILPMACLAALKLDRCVYRWYQRLVRRIASLAGEHR